jgi:hypothetical protein
MKNVLVGVLLVASFTFRAQNGKVFPTMKGTTLDDKAMSLPIKNGKYSVIAVAYHRDAEDALKKWLNPLYDNFMSKDKSSSNFDIDMSEVYDVNFVFVPMISGFKRVADDFKSGTDKAFWKYILDTEKTDIKLHQKELGIEDNKIPYFYVLDKEGKIVETQSGKFTDAKMTKLEEAIKD